MQKNQEELPKFHQTFVPILNFLSESQELHHKDIRVQVREQFYSKLPHDLLSQKTSTGANTLLDRIGWGISYLNMGGYLQRTKRGYYKITSKGTEASKRNTLTLQELKQQKEYIQYQKEQDNKKDKNHSNQKIDDDDQQEDKTPSDLIDISIKRIEQEVKNHLLDRLKDINPYDFEKLVLKLVEAMEYGTGDETPKSRDGGIDGVINQDKLGLEKIYIQAKRFTDVSVSEKHIRDFIGAMSGDTNKGIFITTSKFQENAVEKAKQAHHKIELIDGQRLVELMFHFNVGVKIKKIIEIKEMDDDFFDFE